MILEITFHNNYGTANNSENEGIDTIQLFSGNGATFYVRLAIPFLGEIDPENPPRQEYIVKPLIYTITPTTPIIEKIDVCVDYTINEKLLTLNDYITRLLPTNILNLNPNPVIEFYADQDATIPITELQATREYQRVWVKLRFLQTDEYCEQISPLDIKLIANEGILKPTHVVNLVCDNNNDQQEIINLSAYISEFVQNPDNYTIKYFRNYNATTNAFTNQITNYTNFVFNQNTIVYIQLTDNNLESVCYQKLEIELIFNTDLNPPIDLEDEAHLLICNEANQTFVTYNLDLAIPQLYLETNNPEISTFITGIKYYENIADATLGNDNFIRNPQAFQSQATIPNRTIYARFESVSGCYSIAPIHLNIIGIIKLKNNLNVDVCDQNLDSIYQFNFREWINSLTQDSETLNDLLTDPIANRLANYRIYLTQSDFDNGRFLTPEQEINFILNPAIHTSFIIEATIDGGCVDFVTVQINYSTPTHYNYTIEPICDELNDGFELVDLTQFENNFPDATFIYYRNLNDLNNDSNPIETPSNYNFNETLGENIYFKIFQNGSICPNLGKIEITLKKVPFVEIEDYHICPGTEITITPNDDNWEIDSYRWEDANGSIISNERTITLIEPGIYRLTLTASNGCSFTEEFEISHYDLPTITEVIFQQNSAAVIATGNRTILYSMDGITWQTSNIFENLLPGAHYFYIKFETENCIVGPYKGVIPIIVNTITPNGDGINDSWKIKDMDAFNGQNAKLEIFDRYGKLLYKQESNTELSWNGKQNDRPLPSSSYWYMINLPDGRKYTGYINVINKN
ncbi:T9SS type B sorting domain-containing protein [Faecalibacter bovis]|uniref:T9SS type B sorting domain-containing protein n=1 Tax=Faecalibacter bovis TaxID=2898187 RepID=A0ABX7XEH2_9FLAO|nr:T9SS type B sorting domain-containing protein [Faecalibacter bovis]QTV06182.1 T9SS type B sorting domain-containing protein [Faecalibacter bovis]